MTAPLPQLPGVEHGELELATGVRIHVATAGPADAPRVLALHGWPQHWWIWRHVIERLDGAVRIVCRGPARAGLVGLARRTATSARRGSPTTRSRRSTPSAGIGRCSSVTTGAAVGGYLAALRRAGAASTG